MFKYYRGSAIFTVLAVIVGYILGGPAAALTVAILGVIETTLSFDNAVVNASVLQNWDIVWRNRFLTWGMPVAVFGMRLLFPLIIVGVVVHQNPVSVLNMAIHSPKDYETALTSCSHQISAFGGAFLMMVFLKFFFDQEKDVHWLSWLEKPLQAVGRLDMASVAAAMGAVLITSHYVDPSEQLSFIIAGVCGLITYIGADAVGTLVGGEEGSTNIIKQGIGGLLYLELLDASFSFDGVLASFALTNMIFIIALGLGVGAMFVRSMTLHLVDTGKLSEFRYLEHGAFWAIGVLTVIMFVGTVTHVNELVEGVIGVTYIGSALVSSILANREDAGELPASVG